MAGKHVDDMDNRLKLLKERPKPPQMARNQSWINLVEVHGSLVGDESRCHGDCIFCRKRPEITSNFSESYSTYLLVGRYPCKKVALLHSSTRLYYHVSHG